MDSAAKIVITRVEGGTITIRPPDEPYADTAQQAETARLGIWLFIGSETLFFGGLFTAHFVLRYLYPGAFAAAAAETKLWIGTINTVILLTSSLVFVIASRRADAGDLPASRRLLLVVVGLGLGFLALKGYEYYTDFAEHLVPGPGFQLKGAMSEPSELFFVSYFLLTGLHSVHLMVGIALVLYLWARNGHVRPDNHDLTRTEVIGLYWSFVDVIWLFVYSIVYLPGRSG